MPSGRLTSVHVSAAASERRSRASRITVMMAASMSPRRRAYAADSVHGRPGRCAGGELWSESRPALRRSGPPPAGTCGRADACLRVSPQWKTRRTPGWVAGEGAPREACSWAMAATAARSVEIPAPVLSTLGQVGSDEHRLRGSGSTSSGAHYADQARHAVA